MSKNQREDAMSTLQTAQLLLGQLGFTLNGDGSYHKDYGTTDGSIVRLIPVFDKGISLDVAYRLTGFTVIHQKQIHFVDGLPAQVEEFPMETMADVKNLVSGLAPSSRSQMTDSYMITISCCQCGNDAESFIQLKGQYTCLKCVGMTDA
jgi:hypothetical protein